MICPMRSFYPNIAQSNLISGTGQMAECCIEHKADIFFSVFGGSVMSTLYCRDIMGWIHAFLEIPCPWYGDH